MKIQKIIFSFSFLFSLFLFSCGGGSTDSTDNASGTSEPSSESTSPEDYDPTRGEGKWTAENVNVGATLDQAKATEGEKVANVKCMSCHKLSEERLVGPGWKGVTSRNKPEWIMNFITNPDPMIDKDPKVQAQLELCLVRMPNQSLTDDDARNVVEYMRKNDGVQ